MGGPRLSPETVLEVRRAWGIYRCGSAVALACGVSRGTAHRYRPDDTRIRVGNVSRNDELRGRIEELWREHGDAGEVARLAGVSHYAAYRYRPAAVELQRPVGSGYAAWSREAQDRWDAYWAAPRNLERLGDLLGRRIQ